jgi:phenylacetate-CoA ligase
LAELARLPANLNPRALVSTSMALLPGLRRRLEERFGCPVVDLYSMNETGPIAVAAPDGAGHRLLQHRLYVEVLDAEGAPCPPDVRGEIVVSGGFNPFLPLLRYRTGDWASLDYSNNGQLLLFGLEGRAPVVFRGTDGRLINNIDVTSALKPLALSAYSLHQFADGSLRLLLPNVQLETDPARDALLTLFGPGTSIEIETFIPGEAGKRVQYSSDLA